MTLAERSEAPSAVELVRLAAADPLFYARTFFPKAFRQSSPEFHRAMWEALENPAARNVAIAVFRGGAKTTLLRAFTSRRIAYGLSHTILFVSEAQDRAIESIEWLQRAIRFNHLYAQTFGLKPGKKWTSVDIEIEHSIDAFPIRVMAHGITGQNRGINVDDYRPDLIIVDDPCDEENTATEEQRNKTSALFFGALEKSLAPRSEAPHAKMVLLQTPLHRDDLIEKCLRDPEWHPLRFGCFDDQGKSIWEERFPTEELREKKAAHARRNQISLWMREMECKVISAETSAFKGEWLKFWDVLPQGMAVFMAIDPAPPLSDEARLRGANRDFQAFAVVGFHGGNTYLLDYEIAKDQNPEQTAQAFFRLAAKWKPRMIGVESVAYQRVLAHFLRDRMRAAGRYHYVHEITDRRKKADRIRQALTGRASNGAFYIHARHTEFIEQFNDYPDVSHDDLLDAVAMAITMGAGTENLLDGEFQRITEEERSIESLPGSWRAAV